MRALDCADVRELAPEFALGVLDGDARADVVQHIDRCPACRTLTSELAETADTVVLLAPEAEPPAGFEHRVLQRITGTQRRQRWRTVKLVAAVAAAAMIVSLVTVRVIDGARTNESAAPVATTVPMIGADGTRVGQVQVVDDGGTARLAVTVDYALADGEYRVVLNPESTPREVLGSMSVSAGRGAWWGSTTLGDGRHALELVDAAGTVPCSAELPTT